MINISVILGRRMARRPFYILLLLMFLVIILSSCGEEEEKDYFALADMHFEKGEFNKSAKMYEDYIRYTTQNLKQDQALYKLGEIHYYALGKRLEAVKYFIILIKKFPTSDAAVKAHRILAGVFRDETKQYDEAVKEYQWLIDNDPYGLQVVSYRMDIARIFLLKEDYENAILEFGRLIEEYPENKIIESVYDEMGGAYLSLGRMEQALWILKRMVKIYPKGEYFTSAEFKSAMALESLFRFRDALKKYQKLLDEYPNRGAVVIRIEGLKRRMKDNLGVVSAINYDYRPVENSETLRNFSENNN